MVDFIIGILLCATVVLISYIVVEGGHVYSWIWCRRHGLKLKEAVSPIGGGVTFWWGEDAAGNQYIPDEEGNPELINKEGGVR